MKIKLLIILFLFGAVLNTVMADDFSKAMLKAKKNLNEALNKSDESALLKVRGEYERILQLKTNEWLVNYFIAYVDYNLGYAGMQDSVKGMEKMKKYNSSAMELINKSIEQKDDYGDAYVLKYGINFSRYIYEGDKYMEIAGSAKQLEARVSEIESENPRFYYLQGMSLYYTPEAFGGSVSKAADNFTKAIAIFEKRVEKEEYFPDWGKDYSWGYLALSYNKLGQTDKAKEAYTKALEVNPNSEFLLKFVKNELEGKK